MADLDLSNGIKYSIKPFQPLLTELADQKVVTVNIAGDPNKETALLMPPLYTMAYAVRKQYKDKGIIFKIEKLRGRWPGITVEQPKHLWRGIYALPLPEDINKLPEISSNKIPEDLELHLENWQYGKVAMILHVGAYTAEHETVQKLFAYVQQQGLQILPGSHEEIYLSDPNKTEADKLKTIILYRLIG